jgi:hypothetical protein
MPSIRPRRPRSRPSRPRPSRPSRPRRSRSRSKCLRCLRRLRSHLQRRGWRFEEFKLEPVLEFIVVLLFTFSAKARSDTIPPRPVTAISAKAKKKFFFT